MKKGNIFKYIKRTLGIIFLLIMFLLIIRAALLSPKVWLTSIAGNQTFGIAVDVSTHPTKENTYIVSDKVGKVYQFEEGKNTKTLLLDISNKVKSDTMEEGLLSAEIDPKNPDTIYIYYWTKYNLE